jgi:hypothetical protein
MAEDIKQVFVLRYAHGHESSTGLLFLEDEFACYTLEDAPRDYKIPGATRIPEGVYQLRLRTEGRMHDRYTQLYPGLHKGMLELVDVPDYEWILIHTGNSAAHTEGCILVGKEINSPHTDEGRVSRSRAAYREIYPTIAGWLLLGHTVTITITDMDL